MMQQALLIVILMVCVSCAATSKPATAANWKADGENKAPQTSANLRGFGKVTSSVEKLKSMNGEEVTLAKFEAADAKHASTVLGKYLADLTLSPNVTAGQFAVGERKYASVQVEGGSTFCGVVLNNTAYVVQAPNEQALADFIADNAAIFASKDTKTEVDSYPKFLDRFDHHGWGFYGYAGVHGELDWKNLPGSSGETDPTDDLAWVAKHGFRVEMWLDATQFDRSWGLLYWPELQWKINLAEKLNVPMSSRLYGQVPWVPWMMDMYEEPAWWNQNGYHGNQPGQGLYWKAIPHQSWFHQDSQLYIARQTQEQMNRVKDHDIMSWMHPHGEVVHNEWYNLHADYSANATASWRAELRDKNKVTLAEAGKMYNRATAFKSWDEVTVPEFATFAGLPGEIQDLSGTWYIRPEKNKDEGIAGQWWKADVKTADWDHFKMPGSDFWYKTQGQKWCVRDFEYVEQQAQTRPIYLYAYINPTAAPKDRTTIYLNGESIGEVGLWGAIDVTKNLKAGSNRLAFRNECFDGRIFLSTEPPGVYPHLSEARNKMWIIWHDWLRMSKKQGWETQLKAMRQVDDQRPIKLMAGSAFGTDGWIDMVQKYGGIAHFTGEGVWFFPWYKRAAKLYDLPATSEGAGPANNVQEQVNLFQRIFLEGLDGHDQVFLVQHVTRQPDVREWYENHALLLKQLGRYDISGPQILIFRDFDAMENAMMSPFPETGDATRGIKSSFDWDLGRGTMQTIGQSYLYIDNGGLKDDKLAGHSILMDCGNEVVKPESIDKIEAWVKNGGTYIVWPFTGRGTWTSDNTWPINKLTGCTVEKIRKPGEGKVTIGNDQTLLKEHAGRTFDDAGVSMDFRNVNHNDISVELKPGADCRTIATYENGAAAIVVRNLGKGKVVTLGSAFARDSKDVMGIWWPGEREVNFFRDLFNGLGQPSPNTTSDPRVWVQRYRMNNGVDDVVVVNNFADGDRTITLTAAMDAKPAKVFEIAMNAQREVAFDFVDGQVVIKDLPVRKDEVQIYVLRNNHADSMAHWWNRNAARWRPVETPKVDFSSISKGRWIDPVVDLQEDWKWTQNTSADWFKVEAKDSDWKPGRLDIMNFYGAEAGKTVYLRKHFTVPADWKKDGGAISLAQGAWSGNFFPATVQGQLYFNGEMVHDWNDGPYVKFDITKKLRDGDNVVAVAIRPGKTKFIGAIGSTWVYHEPKPIETKSLAGEWTVQKDGKAATIKLPGKGTGTWPTRTIKIPKEWQDKYLVTYHAVGDRNNSAGIYVNERLVRRHHHLLGDEVEVAINQFLKFGEDNTLVIYQPDQTSWNLSAIELRLYPKTK